MLYDPSKFDNRVQTEDWRRVLREAIKLIDRCGWVQYHSGNEKMGFCAGQAIKYSAYSSELALEYPGTAWLEATKRFGLWVGHKYVPDFNDEYGQNKENVKKALLDCAAQ
jgi:hypothetical protein